MMVRIRQLGAMALLLAASAACAQPFRGEAIAIADDKKGIGFDDLRYSPSLHRVLVPAGRTGNLVLVDPSTYQPGVVARLSKEEAYGGGHGEGTTSADEGEGALYAIDRTSKEVVIIDPAARRIVVHAPLGGSPDYVRYVAPTRELWVTEPDAERIEIFSISPKRDALTSVASIAVPGGPESLVIDAAGGRAFSHLFGLERASSSISGPGRLPRSGRTAATARAASPTTNACISSSQAARRERRW